MAVEVGIGTNNVEKQIKQKLGAVVRYDADAIYWQRIHDENNKNATGYEDTTVQIQMIGNSGTVHYIYEAIFLDLEDQINSLREQVNPMMESGLMKSYDLSVLTFAGSPHFSLAGKDKMYPGYHNPNEKYLGFFSMVLIMHHFRS